MTNNTSLLLTLAALFLFVVGCPYDKEPQTWKMKCTSFGPETPTCMIDCAKAANPMSDEEGEDLVKECANQCKEMFCNKQTLHYYRALAGASAPILARVGAAPPPPNKSMVP